MGFSALLLLERTHFAIDRVTKLIVFYLIMTRLYVELNEINSKMNSACQNVVNFPYFP